MQTIVILTVLLAISALAPFFGVDTRTREILRRR